MGGCPVHWRRFNSSPGFCSLDTSLCPQLWEQKLSANITKWSWEGKTISGWEPVVSSECLRHRECKKTLKTEKDPNSGPRAMWQWVNMSSFNQHCWQVPLGDGTNQKKFWGNDEHCFKSDIRWGGIIESAVDKILSFVYKIPKVLEESSYLRLSETSLCARG